jgi:hypothetical protein
MSRNTFLNGPTEGTYRQAYFESYWNVRTMMRRQIWGSLLKPVPGELPRLGCTCGIPETLFRLPLAPSPIGDRPLRAVKAPKCQS